MKFEVGSGIVLGRAVTTSPSTGLEVFAPGRLDMFLSQELQGTLILPGRSANLAVAPLAVVYRLLVFLPDCLAAAAFASCPFL